jgi:hypothetical protein
VSGKILSLVCPVNKSTDLEKLISLRFLFNSDYESTELIAVIEYSCLSTERLNQFTSEDGIRIVRTKRSVSIDLAIFAGLQRALGDHILVLKDADIATANELTSCLGEEFSYVLSTYPRGGRRVYEFLSAACRPMINALGCNLPPSLSYNLAMTRDVVSYLLRRRQYNRKIQLQLWMMAEPDDVVKLKIKGHDKTVNEGVMDLASVLVQSSTKTLRFGAMSLLFAGLIATLTLLFVITAKLFGANLVEGWASSTIILLALFTIVSFVSAVIFLYLTRIIEDTAGDAGFIVGDELVSNKTFDLSRINVDIG